MNPRKPIKLKWDDAEYKTIVNMALIGRIDDEVGILKLVRMKSGDPKIFIIVQLVYILLEEAGLDITLDDVWDGLGDKIDPKALFSILSEITPMLLPNFNGIGKKKPTPKKKTKPRKKALKKKK